MALGTTSAGPGVALTIPVIDLAPLAAGAPGAPDTVAAALADAPERVGFFYVVGHGVPAVAWCTGQNYHGEAAAPPPR